MAKVRCNESVALGCVFWLTTSFDLPTLIFCPLMSQNSSRIAAITVAWDMEASPKSIKLSAKKMCEIPGLFMLLSQFSIGLLSLLYLWTVPTIPYKAQRDRGERNPLSKAQIIESLVDLMQNIIKSAKCFSKPTAIRVFSKKFQLTQSYAFSKSTFIAMAPSLPFLSLMEWIIS